MIDIRANEFNVTSQYPTSNFVPLDSIIGVLRVRTFKMVHSAKHLFYFKSSCTYESWLQVVGGRLGLFRVGFGSKKLLHPSFLAKKKHKFGAEPWSALSP